MTIASSSGNFSGGRAPEAFIDFFIVFIVVLNYKHLKIKIEEVMQADSTVIRLFQHNPICSMVESGFEGVYCNLKSYVM